MESMMFSDAGNDDQDVLMGLLSGEKKRPFKLTVEIPIFCLLFSFTLTNSATYNVLLERICAVDLGHNATECAALRSVNKTVEAQQLENEVELLTTKMVMTLAILSGITPAILSLFLGSWSEKFGRKPLLLYPLFGQLISSILILMFVACSLLSSWWYVLCALPFTILGGGSTFGLGANLIITDVTSEANRSFRLSLLQGCHFIGVLAGSLASNYVYYSLGHVFLFTISAVIYLLTFYYTIYFVEESVRPAQRSTFGDLCDMSTVPKMINIWRKPRPYNIAFILFLLVFAFGTTIFCVSGVNNLSYLFTRETFQWILMQYNIFNAIDTLATAVGMIIGVFIFQHLLRMSDGLLLILAYTSSTIEAIMWSISHESWQLYIATIVSVLSGLALPLIRSQISKVVPKCEIGVMYAVLSCVEAILPVFSPMLFSTTYFQTLSEFPGMIYIVSAALYAACLVCVLIAEWLILRLPKGFHPTASYLAVVIDRENAQKSNM